MWKVDSAVFLSVIMWIWRFPFHSFYCRSLKRGMGYNQLQNASMCKAHGKTISSCISALTASLLSETAGTWISAPENILTSHMLFSCPVRKQSISSPPPQPSDIVKLILDQPEHGLDKTWAFYFLTLALFVFSRFRTVSTKPVLLWYMLFVSVFYNQLLKVGPFF